METLLADRLIQNGVTMQEWVSVDERLPEESLNSVIGWDEYRERCVFVQYYKGEWILGDHESVKITHWMSLPELPKGGTVMNEYKTYTEITKELLDQIEVGDLIKVNDWDNPLQVKAVSENYFVMATKLFGDTEYSVCEKKQWGGIRYNKMIGGMFHVGTDSWVFGWPGDYNFDNPEIAAKYLKSFEDGESELSPRNTVPIFTIQIGCRYKV